MRFRFFAALLIVIIGASTFWYQSTAGICPVPLPYRLGQFDSEFNLTPEEAKQHMQTAEQIWEDEAGRNLFDYDENATFVVNFVFDERQEFADEETIVSRQLDQQRETNEEVFGTIDSLQAQYENLKTDYEAAANSYEERLRAYNEVVQRFNDQGGAPANEFERLQREQAALDGESTALNSMADDLNALAMEINELGQRGNELVQEYNRDVAVYNRKYGYTREFTQGDYQGGEINIYKFSTDRELVAVLTHEFGHALGIGHVEGDDSIMYYLLVDTDAPIMLSAEDRAALFTTCGDGTDIASTIRRHIRELLTPLNI